MINVVCGKAIVDGNRIREMRESKGLSQEKLAREIDVSLRTVANWESGNTDIPSAKLIQLSMLFNCSAEYLYGLPAISGS